MLGLLEFVFQFYSTVADRYMYVPMLGVAMAVAWVLSRHRNRFVILGFSVLIIVLGALSFVQAGVWRDTHLVRKRGYAESNAAGSVLDFGQ